MKAFWKYSQISIKIDTPQVLVLQISPQFKPLAMLMNYEIMFNADQKIIYLISNYFMYIKQRRTIAFERVKAVYLDCVEEKYSVSTGEYTQEEQYQQRWHFFLDLGNHLTVTIVEQITDYDVQDEPSLLSHKNSLEEIANRVCTITNKLFIRTSSVPGGPYTFVDLIDQILQRQLKQSDITEQHVKLRSSQNSDLEIVVDNKIYGGLEEIEDEIIHNLIQDAIHEWEQVSIIIKPSNSA